MNDLAQTIVNLALAKKTLEDKIADDVTKPVYLCNVKIRRKAIDLVDPCRKCAEYHRTREKHYVTKLEEAEKELKEKGITLEAVVDQTGNISYNAISSGAMGLISSQQGNLTARIDPKLLDAVKQAKNKVLEHQKNATQFEKYLRTFKLAPDTLTLELSVEDIAYFRLGDE